MAGRRYALVLSSHSGASYAVSEDLPGGYPDGDAAFQFDPFGQFGPPSQWFALGSDLIFATCVESWTNFDTFTPRVTASTVGTRTRVTADGSFRLGHGSNGIAPIAEGLDLLVNDLHIEVPPNAFTPSGRREVEYDQTVAGNRVAASLETEADGTVHLHATVTGTVSPPAAPVTVTLTIGDDTGTVTALTR